ncbi:hypothetical protein MYAM1_000679 [Malassezia yamatoensis]|uniref:Uncharacterized protein n=1 Tax=Malassezia yamatoensis TaxID=253288 RepID=A0AAJ5YWY7_9BASI|nr:hypothetical protein MYAM1_000679 [Malassezia yamatoensis]
MDVQISKFSKPNEDHGVYSCYVPGQRVLRASPKWRVGDVLRILGRVFERRDASRAVEVEMCERVDETEEPQHILRALKLGLDTYSYAPNMPPGCQLPNRTHMENLALDSMLVHKENPAYNTRSKRLRHTNVGAWSNTPRNTTHLATAQEMGSVPSLDTRLNSKNRIEQNLRVGNKAQHTPSIQATTRHSLRDSADTKSVPSTQSFVNFLKHYLTRKTGNTSRSQILRGPSAIPRFTLSHLQLSASVISEANRLIILKRPNASMSREVWDRKINQLLSHCMRKLIRAGVLLNYDKSRSFQVICPSLIAAYIAVLVKHTPRRRAADIRCFSSAAMRQRVCVADQRLHSVSLVMFDTALELLEQYGIVKKVQNQWCAREDWMP